MHAREHRLLTSKSVCLFYNGERRYVQVSNLSARGACLEGLRPPPVGTPVTIHQGPLRIEAKVAWASDRLAGVQFLSPLAPLELLELQFG